jgi:hypothetical protein
MATIKKAQGGGLIKKVIKATTKTAPKKTMSLTDKVKEAKFQKNKGKFGMTEDITLKEFKKGAKKIGKDSESYSTSPPSPPVVLTAEQKANNARILREIREGKRKNGGPVKKVMKTGGMVKKAQKGVNLPPALQQTGKPSIKNSGYIANTSEEMSKVKKYSPSKEGFKSVNDTTYKRSTRKYKNGGSLSGLKASTKRVGPVDPKGAYTQVQQKAIAGAKGKASLTKDKQLGATKMKMGGKMKKC